MIPENTHRRTLLTAAAGVFAADDRICIGVIGGGGRGDSLCRDIAKNQNEVRTRPRSHVPRPQAADRKKQSHALTETNSQSAGQLCYRIEHILP